MIMDRATLIEEMLNLMREDETIFGESQAFKSEYINPFDELDSNSDGIHYARQHLLHVIRMTSMIAEKEVGDNQIVFTYARVDDQQRMVLVTCTASLTVKEKVFENAPRVIEMPSIFIQIRSAVKRILNARK